MFFGRQLQDDGAGLVADDKTVDALGLIRNWVFISLIYTMVFSFSWLRGLLSNLYKQSMEPSKVKIKNKPLGHYSENDSKRILMMRESIYSLAFASNMKNSFLQQQGAPP